MYQSIIENGSLLLYFYLI